jgi:Cu-Zn family superoxide dismutase
MELTRNKLRVLAVAGLGGALCALGVGATAFASSDSSARSTTYGAAAKLRDGNGAVLGTVRFLPRDDGSVLVRATLSPLTTGWHGFHVHAVGRCEAPFTTAGPHFDTTGSTHGSHSGDMPLLRVMRSGEARVEFFTDTFTIASLFDADGSAVIVHAAADNYANIPSRYTPTPPDATTLGTGDAGARVACGVVQKG